MTKINRGKELIPRAVMKILNDFSRQWIDWQTAKKRIDEYYKRHRIKRCGLIKLHGNSRHQIVEVVRARASGQGLKSIVVKMELSRGAEHDTSRMVQRIVKQLYDAAQGKSGESYQDRFKRRKEYELALNNGIKPENHVKVCVDAYGVATLQTKGEIFAMFDKQFSRENIDYLNGLAKK